MSSISREEFIAEYGFHPEGTEPLLDRDHPDRMLDDRQAAGAMLLVADENRRWFDRLLGIECATDGKTTQTTTTRSHMSA